MTVTDLSSSYVSMFVGYMPINNEFMTFLFAVGLNNIMLLNVLNKFNEDYIRES
jgi:hypothetical protein